MLAETSIKLAVENYKTTAIRYGKFVVTRSNNLPETEVDLPGCLLSTVAGTVQNLTKETLSYIPQHLIPSVYQFPVKSVINHEKIIKGYPGSTEEFFSLPPKGLTYLTTHDPCNKIKTGYNTKKGVAIFGHNGKVTLTMEGSKSLVEAIKPTFYEILADNDTLEASGKRIVKSMANSKEFLKNAVEAHMAKASSTNSLPMICLQGGNELKSRIQYLEWVSEILKEEKFDAHAGFVVDSLPLENGQEICNELSQRIPNDKLRVIHGKLGPREILNLIENGCDLFDCTYPCVAAETGDAFTFPLNVEDKFESESISLLSEKHSRSFIPILDNCECYTCKRHTRAYINHLFNTREMLAAVLMTLHNLQHYLTFFQNVRKYLNNGEYEKFKKIYEK